MEPRRARSADLQAAATWLGLEHVPAAWDDDLDAGAGFVVDDDGQPAGLALLRCWGRVLALPALVVDPARRRRGHGRRLIGAVREEALRRDARSLGLEADPFDLESLSGLMRLGFKAGPPLVEVDWDLPASDGEPPELVRPSQDEVAAVASALDAGFEPTAWLEQRERGGARLFGVRASGGDWQAVVLAEPAEEPDAQPGRLSLALVDQSEPFEALDALADACSAAGLTRVRLGVPARQADALRALLSRGARCAGLRLRLGFGGFPERSDLRRLLLAPWR